MSKGFNLNMSFEPEFVRSLLSGDDEATYVEDFRGRSSASVVFENAQRFQAEYLSTRLREEDLISAWNGSQEFLSSLDVLASQEGVIGQVASLRGRGIELPKFETDLAGGVGLISLLDTTTIDEQSLEKYYRADEVQGMFSGFTVRLIKEDENVYVPKLAYQVSFSTIDTPHAHVTMYATGIVGEAELVFEADEKKEVMAPLLEKLFDLCPERADSISLIAMALAGKEAYDASAIRHIAYHSEKILNTIKDADKSITAEDVLIELLASHVKAGDSAFIKTPSFSLSPENHDTGPQYWYDEDLYSLNGTFLGFVVLPEPVFKEGEVTYRDRRQLCAALAHDSRYIYTPLSRAQEFTQG